MTESFSLDKKIVIAINNLSFGGAERVVVDQINELVARGYDVRLVMTVASLKKNFVDLVRLPQAKIEIISANKFSFKSLVLCFRYLRRHNPDIIITHLFFTSTIMRLAAVFIYPRPRIFVYEHNEYWASKTWKHLLVDAILSLVTTRIIAVSEGVRRYLGSQYLPVKKISIIPNGIDQSFIKSLKSKDSVRQHLGLRSDHFVIIAVGNIHPQKGHDILIEALSEIKNEYKDRVICLICGNDEGDYASELKERVRELGLDKMIRFLGSRTDVHDLINVADLYCMPSRWEGLPIALLEAIALEKMIVISRIPSLTSVIRDRVTGLVFECENYHNLSYLIEGVVSGGLPIDIYQNNVKLLARRYSIKNNVDLLVEIFK